MRSIWKQLLALGLFAVFVVFMNMLPFQEWLKPLLRYMESAGPPGYAVFLLLSVILVTVFVPVTLLVTASGLLFGLGMGFLMISLTLLAGISIGYVAGRKLWPWLEKKESFRQPVFQAVRKTVEREGNYLVCLLRMTPFFHFMTGNLFFGSLNLNFPGYLFYSYLGMIPGTLMLVYAGSLANRSVNSDEGVSVLQLFLTGAGLLIFAYVSYRVTRLTRDILKEPDQEE